MYRLQAENSALVKAIAQGQKVEAKSSHKCVLDSLCRQVCGYSGIRVVCVFPPCDWL